MRYQPGFGRIRVADPDETGSVIVAYRTQLFLRLPVLPLNRKECRFLCLCGRLWRIPQYQQPGKIRPIMFFKPDRIQRIPLMRFKSTVCQVCIPFQSRIIPVICKGCYDVVDRQGNRKDKNNRESCEYELGAKSSIRKCHVMSLQNCCRFQRCYL